MQNKIETNDFEKIKTAIFILAEAIENGRIQGVCHDVTEALYPDNELVDHSELGQDNETFNTVKKDWDTRAENLMNGLDQDKQQ